ncbi:MAG: hypothetical protein M3R24_22580 [Chloroflexota bacterium]|nr:hypothetical protein [Chloroflexota bacterium]
MESQKAHPWHAAPLANVSVSAVSSIVRNIFAMAAGTCDFMWKAILQLGHVFPDKRQPARPPTIGLLTERGQLPAMGDIFYGAVIRSLQSEAQQLGYCVLLHMYDCYEERFDRMYASLEADVQGFVIANVGEAERSFHRGYSQMRELLKLLKPPTAIVAVHDKIGFSAMEAIKAETLLHGYNINA